MNVNWDAIKYDFLYFIKDHITSFDEFNKKLSALESNTLKGIYFEYFCKLYFTLLPINKNLYKKIYMYSDISDKIKNKLNLPEKDKGIDAIIITNINQIYAIQVKFRTNLQPIPFGDLATFPALTFGTAVTGIAKGIMFTNCLDVCDELKNDKYINITYDCFDKCDTFFWTNVKSMINNNLLCKYKIMKPLVHQLKIFPLIKAHYQNNNNGRLYLPCGTGKTFVAYWTATKILKYTNIFIVVPSLYLLSETYETWQKEVQYNKPKIHFTLIGSDIDNRHKCEYKPTTNINDIKHDLLKYTNIVVITTYQSSNLLVNMCKRLNYKFDLGIFDEAHRTVGKNNTQFTCILSDKFNIAKNRLFMTATEKIYCSYKSKLLAHEQKEKVLSMDNKNIYGNVIYSYSTLQAINDKRLVDYKIVAPFISTNVYDDMIHNNDNIKHLDATYEINLILLCLMIVTAMKECKFTHLLIFSNKNEKAKKIIEIIAILLKNDTTNSDNIYLKYLSGKDNMTIRKSEVYDFINSKKGSNC